MFETDVAILFEQVDIAVTGATALRRHIRQSVARTGTHANRVGETYAAIHQAVEHAAGEHTAHTAPFEYQTRCRSQLIVGVHHCFFDLNFPKVTNFFEKTAPRRARVDRSPNVQVVECPNRRADMEIFVTFAAFCAMLEEAQENPK